MGNNFSSDPNRVEIFIDGCNGGMAYLCGSKFSYGVMDSRLAPYVTQEEYTQTITKVNETLAKEQRRSLMTCGVLLSILGVAGVIAAIFSGIHKPEERVCGAPNGYCGRGVMDAAAGYCCRAWCCNDNNAPAPFSGCQETDRRVEGEECACTGQKNNRRCTYVKIEGEIETIPEENGWAALVAGGFAGIAVISCVSNIGIQIARGCQLSQKMQPHFSVFQSKGLICTYFPGGKHSRTRISVQLPAGAPQVYGAPPPAPVVGAAVVQAIHVQPAPVKQSMQVQAPPGAVQGTLLQVQAPNGQTLQVQIPPGVPPGGIFEVQY